MAGRIRRTNAAASGQLKFAPGRPICPRLCLAVAGLTCILGTASAPETQARHTIKDSERILLLKQLKQALDANARAQLRLKAMTEALAAKLPVLLPYIKSMNGRDLNCDKALRRTILSLVGPNPFDQETDLKSELNRVRASNQAEQTGEKIAALYFMPVANLDDASLSLALTAEKHIQFDPGTLIVFINDAGGYAVGAIGIDGTAIKVENQPFYKHGQLRPRL